MNLNQIAVPSTDVARAAEFYRTLGLIQIVDARPDYARFECPDGDGTLSVQLVDKVARGTGWSSISSAMTSMSGFGRSSWPGSPSSPGLLRDPDGNAICLFRAGTNRRFPPWRLERQPA